MTKLDVAPLRFDPADERQAAGERATEAAIGRSMRGILETTWRDYGHAARAVHAKSHALLEGELRVLDDLPDELAQGLFARPATYPVVLRLSTNPGDILDDSVSAPRGLAIKVIGVEGERLPGSEGERTQDFVMAGGPAFVAPGTSAFARNLKVLAATTDTGQGWKKALSAVLRGVVALRGALGLEPGPLKALGGQKLTNPLGDIFHTQTPFRYGDHVAKLCLAPSDVSLVALRDRPVPVLGRPNGLREALIAHFRARGGTWELRVQLRTDPKAMPIEDASVPWPESASPYRTVARLTVGPQPAWSETRAREADDGLSFSPWHGLAAHQPLGGINRARREVYAMSAAFRAERNHCPIHEPRERLALSGEPASAYGTAPGREGRRPGTPDARPGAWTQPLAKPVRHAVAGTIAGLGAGLLLSAIWLGMEAATGETSELVRLHRRGAARLGGRARRESARPRSGELAAAHGGHLALSAAAGLVYGAGGPIQRPLLGGAALGAGFYAVAYGVIGPALGTAPPVWRDAPESVAEKGVFHLLFGVTTALLTRSVTRRL